MQKWEYKVYRYNSDMVEEYENFIPDDIPRANTKRFEYVLNLLGAQGWELLVGEASYWILRKPIAPEPWYD